jgi:glycosyltransferase involved in cell wall biosynthesis
VQPLALQAARWSITIRRMKVVARPADNTACGTYRLLAPAAVLVDTEPTVQIEMVEELPLVRDGAGRIVGVLDMDCDVFVLQRPLHDWLAASIPFLQRNGVRVVVEIDDDFNTLHPENGSFAHFHPTRSPSANWHHLAAACEQADLVTVTTPALAERYGRHGRVHVLPNYVPARVLDLPRAGDGRTVGWTGLVVNHPDDLQTTRGGVATAVEEMGARFVNVGSGEHVQLNLGLCDPIDATGWVDMDRYFREITRFDVAIAPLADTAFNEAKSGLKLIEAAACGVPCVASPRPEYRDLARQGIGVLAGDRARKWHREVKRLLKSPARRDELSEQGRQIVRDHHTIEANAWKWAECWASLLA